MGIREMHAGWLLNAHLENIINLTTLEQKVLQIENMQKYSACFNVIGRLKINRRPRLNSRYVQQYLNHPLK